MFKGRCKKGLDKDKAYGRLIPKLVYYMLQSYKLWFPGRRGRATRTRSRTGMVTILSISIPITACQYWNWRYSYQYYSPQIGAENKQQQKIKLFYFFATDWATLRPSSSFLEAKTSNMRSVDQRRGRRKHPSCVFCKAATGPGPRSVDAWAQRRALTPLQQTGLCGTRSSGTAQTAQCERGAGVSCYAKARKHAVLLNIYGILHLCSRRLLVFLFFFMWLPFDTICF